MNNKLKQHGSNIILVVILILALALRFSKMFWQRDFWYDEAFTGIITRMSWSEMWWMIFHDVHPPLYYYLLKPWAAWFDYSMFGFRSFSVLFGVLSVVSIYWIGRRLFNERVGLTAAFLMAISPFAIQYSQEARMYSFFGFVMLWAMYFFSKALKNNLWKDWLTWGVFGSLLLYTHYLFLFIFVVFYLTAFFYKVIIGSNWQGTALDKFRTFGRDILVDKKAVVAVIIMGIFFVLWLPAFKQHRSREGLGWVPVIYISEIPQTLQFFFYGHQPGKILEPIPNEFRNINFTLSKESSGNLLDGGSVGLIIFGIFLWGLIFWRKYDKWKGEILILCGLTFGVLLFLILLSQIGWRFYVARYFMATAVLIYLFLAVIIAGWKSWRQWMLLSCYVLTLLWLKPIPYDHSWTDVLADKKIVNGNTMVVADNAFEYATARFHFGEGRVKLYNKGEPTQDLSAWIIIKKGDQVEELDNYLLRDNVIYVGAGDCNWNEYELRAVKKIGRLQVCRKNIEINR